MEISDAKWSLFRSHVTQGINTLLEGKTIDSTAAYFEIWGKARRILEAEVMQAVNYSIDKKLSEIRDST